MPTRRALALAPWSSSKIQTALRCPRLFHYRYTDRVPEPEVMPETRIGKAVHECMERVLKGMALPVAVDQAAKGLNNRDEDDRYRRLCRNIPAFIERLDEFRRRYRVAQRLVEWRLAVDGDFQACAFSSRKAFFRGIIDLAFRYETTSYALVDHKSGIRQPNSAIASQLDGYAVLAAFSFPNLERVFLGIHWLSDKEVDWSAPLGQAGLRVEGRARILANIEAAALTVADGPRPTPSSWCLRCSYRSLCPAAHEERFEPEVEPDPGIG